ncbi:MAG TPA: hypothetical protein VKA17_06345 [Gammaproteobacteria bacterium]|nr:hypothetical protein [Gammaproteobacteria bacterium]
MRAFTREAARSVSIPVAGRALERVAAVLALAGLLAAATPAAAAAAAAEERSAAMPPATAIPVGTAPAPSHAAKPGAPLEIAAEVLERAAPGGEFRVRAEITPAIAGELLLLEWRAAPGIEFDGGTTMEVAVPAAGVPLVLQASGRWSGELPGRVYLSAKWQGEQRRVPRSIAISVIDAASEARLTRPATRDGVRAEQAEP